MFAQIHRLGTLRTIVIAVISSHGPAAGRAEHVLDAPAKGQ
jgi:hypothetical protein